MSVNLNGKNWKHYQANVMEGILLPKKDKCNIAYPNYGFKTKNYPSQCKELQSIEKDLLDTIILGAVQ